MSNVYIAGKITDLENYEELFKAKEEIFLELGYNVMNPCVLPPGFSHQEYMVVCYAMINVCDTVYFLNNWKDSKGASLEFDYAFKYNKTIVFEKEVVE